MIGLLEVLERIAIALERQATAQEAVGVGSAAFETVMQAFGLCAVEGCDESTCQGTNFCPVHVTEARRQGQTVLPQNPPGEAVPLGDGEYVYFGPNFTGCVLCKMPDCVKGATPNSIYCDTHRCDHMHADGKLYNGGTCRCDRHRRHDGDHRNIAAALRWPANVSPPPPPDPPVSSTDRCVAPGCLYRRDSPNAPWCEEHRCQEEYFEDGGRCQHGQGHAGRHSFHVDWSDDD